MNKVHCLNPLADSYSELLILGSMPGIASLTAGQYYAHPQNSFWKILAELLQFDRCIAYDQRVCALLSARIAVWDVIDSCIREGSSDAMIQKSSLIINDFQNFFKTHRHIRKVFFNGAQAEICYTRHVMSTLDSGSIAYKRLPSTSPANASYSFAQKLDAWRVIVE